LLPGGFDPSDGHAARTRRQREYRGRRLPKHEERCRLNETFFIVVMRLRSIVSERLAIAAHEDPFIV
jgi:hypothetical protein